MKSSFVTTHAFAKTPPAAPVVDELAFNVVKVFSATMARDRDYLGDRITAWLQERPDLEVVDKAVMMSSDDQFHCLTIVVFAHEPAKGPFGLR